MTTFSRVCAALSISALAAVSAGCSSSSEAPKVAAPASDKAAYCAPLSVAKKARPAQGQAGLDEAMIRYGKLLDPAAAAASTAGKTEVADFLSLVAKMNSNPTNEDPQQIADAVLKSRTADPIILKDCGFEFMK